MMRLKITTEYRTGRMRVYHDEEAGRRMWTQVQGDQVLCFIYENIGIGWHESVTHPRFILEDDDPQTALEAYLELFDDAEAECPQDASNFRSVG